MQWLNIPGMNDENEDQNEVKYMSDLLNRFIEENPDLLEQIAEPPVEEGIEPDPKAKANALFTILRELVIFLKKTPDRHEGIDFNISKLNPTDAH